MEATLAKRSLVAAAVTPKRALILSERFSQKTDREKYVGFIYLFIRALCRRCEREIEMRSHAEVHLLRA